MSLGALHPLEFLFIYVELCVLTFKHVGLSLFMFTVIGPESLLCNSSAQYFILEF